MAPLEAAFGSSRAMPSSPMPAACAAALAFALLLSFSAAGHSLAGQVAASSKLLAIPSIPLPFFARAAAAHTLLLLHLIPFRRAAASSLSKGAWAVMLGAAPLQLLQALRRLLAQIPSAWAGPAPAHAKWPMAFLGSSPAFSQPASPRCWRSADSHAPHPSLAPRKLAMEALSLGTPAVAALMRLSARALPTCQSSFACKWRRSSSSWIELQPPGKHSFGRALPAGPGAACYRAACHAELECPLSSRSHSNPLQSAW